jgi:hypothetical protein
VREGRAVAAFAGLALALVAWPGSAAATSIAPNPKQVSEAFTATSSCGSLAGIGVAWTATANVVSSVSLTSIPAACAGGRLSLTLVGTGNASLASAGPVNVAGTSLTLGSLTGSATATSVTAAYVSVVGP